MSIEKNSSHQNNLKHTKFDDKIAQKLKEDLYKRYAYIELITALDPKNGLRNNQELRSTLNKILNFINQANEEELSEEVDHYTNVLNILVEHYCKIISPKIDVLEIGKRYLEDYRLKYNQSTLDDLIAYGLDCGWLENLIDCSGIFPKDFPYHGKVGIMRNAGNFALEEVQVLKDSFFLLLSAQNSFKRLEHFFYDKEARKKMNFETNYKMNTNFKENIVAYCRISIQSFFNFIEIFVNSIGYDYYCRFSGSLTSKEEEILQGYKKGRYISLMDKMEHFPRIIQGKKTKPLVLKDKNHIKDPFKTFFTIIKETRDSATHFSPQKKPIFRKIDDWLKEAEETAKITMKVALEFWNVCYPSRNPPEYLLELDYDKNLKDAKARTKFEN